uniref:Mitochondrial assembly of ribosomal large subunit protein 1 n=1 Tax=Daphnia dolichocephala TaxID=2282166 RepID=A0A4Y7M0Y3_9CRUS|nr:EOG090X0AI9 [Daphnia dolichocephala]
MNFSVKLHLPEILLFPVDSTDPVVMYNYEIYGDQPPTSMDIFESVGDEASITFNGSMIFADVKELTILGDQETVEEFDEFQGITLQRGTTGIFDIEEFVEILGQQKLENIVVIAIPPQLNYVDYMVITTGKSPRQMTAIAEFLRKISKRRCLSSDPLPVVEGKNNKDWIALDLGNIALHIFSSQFRKIYDLETLWTCGAEFDDLSNEKDDFLTTIMKGQQFPSQA